MIEKSSLYQIYLLKLLSNTKKDYWNIKKMSLDIS